MKSPGQDGFGRIVQALGPYLDELVIVGAWCHRLFRLHPLAMPTGFPPLMTEDADIATPERLRSKTPSIDQALRAAGFTPSLTGDGRLPVMRYHGQGVDRGLYVEPIAPLRGSGYTRKGEPDDLVAVAGATAQRLRHVDLLLLEPWRLELSQGNGFEVGDHAIGLQVANPASYLAQKVLTLNRRPSAGKRSKDALYVHDTLMLFGDALTELREQAERVLDRLPSRAQREFHTQRVSLFRDDALIVRAASIAAASGRPNPPSPATITAVCTVGLERIFAP
jgi:hypothetical protein